MMQTPYPITPEEFEALVESLIAQMRCFMARRFQQNPKGHIKKSLLFARIFIELANDGTRWTTIKFDQFGFEFEGRFVFDYRRGKLVKATATACSFYWNWQNRLRLLLPF